MSHVEKLMLVGFILITSSDIRTGWYGAVQIAVAMMLGLVFVNYNGGDA